MANRLDLQHNLAILISSVMKGHIKESADTVVETLVRENKTDPAETLPIKSLEVEIYSAPKKLVGHIDQAPNFPNKTPEDKMRDIKLIFNAIYGDHTFEPSEEKFMLKTSEYMEKYYKDDPDLQQLVASIFPLLFE